MTDVAMTDIDRMIARHQLDVLHTAGLLTQDAVNAVEGLDHVDLEDLIAALCALKGHPDGTKGVIGYLQVVARDIEDQIAARMPSKWISVADVVVEKSPANEWHVDPERVVRPLTERVIGDLGYTSDDHEAWSAAHTAVTLTVECLGSSETKWSTTKLRQVLDMPKPTKANGLEDDAFEEIADQKIGAPKLTLHRPDAEKLPKAVRGG